MLAFIWSMEQTVQEKTSKEYIDCACFQESSLEHVKFRTRKDVANIQLSEDNRKPLKRETVNWNGQVNDDKCILWTIWGPLASICEEYVLQQ